MASLKQVLYKFRNELALLYNAKEAESICMMVLIDVTSFSSAKIKAFPETELTEQQSGTIHNILNELKTGKPIQYILGYAEFYGLKFKVNPSVLIPRPETEELVEWVLSAGRGADGGWRKSYNILDIGTGSGCIAISLKKNIPESNVSAMDISVDALETAQINAALNSADINFINDDILAPRLAPNAPLYNIIVSNPPYVTLHDKTQMHQNVVGFEPHTALFVPENDPLVFYKAIADFATTNLEPGGVLFFEINESYGKQIIEILSSKSFTNIELKKDMSDRDRMIKANFSGETK